MATRIFSALLLFCLLTAAVGCSRGGAASAPDAPPAPRAGTPSGAIPPSGPLSAPQTTARLPPPRPVPEGAAPPRRPLLPPPVAEVAAPVVRQPEAQPAPVPAVSRPTAETPEQPAARPPLPQLGPILSDGERRAYNQEIDNSVLAVRGLLETLMTRSLDSDQTAAVKRIRAFLMQAGETRDQDLARSRNLAERARILAEDLERSTR